MLNYHNIRLLLQATLHICLGCCLAFASFLWLSPAHALAQAASDSSNPPTLKVDIGFEDMSFRSGYWTPIHIALGNSGSDFQGTLAVSIVAGAGFWGAPIAKQPSPWQFAEPISLSKGAHQQFTLYAPFFLSNSTPRGVSASLRDQHGKTVASQLVSSTHEVIPGSFFVGLLASPNADFDPLNTLLFPNDEALTLSSLDASSFPTMDAVLENFDIIILENFDTSKLHQDQLLALQTWVNRGGVLVEVGGAQWHSTLGSLPASLLPVQIHGISALPAGTQLWSGNNPALQSPEQQSFLTSALTTPTVISTATVRSNQAFSHTETLLASGTTPLIVQAHQGQGTICYIAFDPANANMGNWAGINEFWRLLLIRALGDSVLTPSSADPYYGGPGQVLTRAGVLNMIVPETLPGPYVLFTCLIGYALLLGPLRILLMRKLKLPRWWSWRLLVGSVVLFTLLTYPFSLFQRNASITDNSISILQVNQNGSSAHSTTYSGIFVPDAGNVNLHIPGESLAQPIATQFLSLLSNHPTAAKKDTPATVVAGSNDTNLNLQGVSSWSLQYTLSEQDIQLPGSIATDLSVHNNKLVGTIQNTLNTPLSDVYILFPHGFASVGRLEAGETQQVELPLFSASPQSGKTLADQIDGHAGVAESYFPYTNKAWPAQSDFQRHMALLSALNGVGFSFPPCQNPCKYHAITDRNTIYVTGGRVPNPAMTSSEPLILDNAPATLIAWVDQPVTDDVTINGWHPVGRRESFLQMPVNVNLSNTEASPDLISGQIADVQSYDAELSLPGIYTMTDGSITFELTMPQKTDQPVHSLTITEPDLWAHPFGPAPDSSGITSHLQALLYNWQTASWDTITLKEDSFTTTNLQAYIGPGGHIYVQVTNLDTSQGKLYFGAPTLHLNTQQ
ncbi:MAG TPA: hypothetical protein VFB12_32060 [Ktedonobacteraceae bacterium]|nr:hypothetical protein [Ktedonobacteraceae bacterium]